MGLHRLVEKVLTGVQFGTAYADEVRAIPFARAGPIEYLFDAQPSELSARTSGTMFISRGVLGLVVAIPAVATIPSGVYWDFYNAVDQQFTLDGDADEFVGYGADAAIQVIRAITVGQRSGWGIRMISDGTQYLWMLHLGNNAQTIAKVS